MKIVNNAQAKKKVISRPQGSLRLHDYFGESVSVVDGPQAFLVEQDPHSEGKPHFHDVDQFQIFARGDGKMGKHPVHPFSVHYADAFTPYGPISAGNEGLGYFTIRIIGATGNWPMPVNSDKIPRKPGQGIGRFFTVNFESCKTPVANGQVVREMLWGPAPDGLAVVGFWMGSGAVAMSDRSEEPGQYILVCSGSLIYEGQTYTEGALGLLAAGEEPVELRAGEAGAQLLLMQFARPSDRPGSSLGSRASHTVDYVMH